MLEKIKCPVCNQRLFDLCGKLYGEIEIKCPRCKRVIRLKQNTLKSKVS